MDNCQVTNIDPSEIQIGQFLGEGSFGQVYVGEYKGKTIVLKKIKNTDQDDMCNEVKILKHLRNTCDHYVCFDNYIKIDQDYYIVTEYLEGYVTLDRFFKKYKIGQNLPLKHFSRICDLLIKGMEKFHTNQVAHRDIKPENIMIYYQPTNNPVKIIIKYIDFGLACFGENCDNLICGTPDYSAPNVHRHFKVSSPCADTQLSVTTLLDWIITDYWSLYVSILSLMDHHAFSSYSNAIFQASEIKCMDIMEYYKMVIRLRHTVINNPLFKPLKPYMRSILDPLVVTFISYFICDKNMD